MDKNKIYYSLPNFYKYFRLNLTVHKMLTEECPEKFRDNVVIDSMYGSFPGIIWNGGRNQTGQMFGIPMENAIDKINKRGISVRYTYTNPLLEETHFADTYGNVTLTIANKYSGKYKNQFGETVWNGVNVNVPKFAKYIDDNYDNLYRLWSTTKDFKDVNEVNEYSHDALTVLPYWLNNNFEELEKLDKKENIEILVAEPCVDNCPFRQLHYQSLAQLQMGESVKEFQCPQGRKEYFYEVFPNKGHAITPELIETEYLPRGFNQFKISGRNEHFVNLIEHYVTYLVKPEYKDDIRNRLLLDELTNKRSF